MKYYTLEELEVGMRVSVASLDKIVDVPIGLDVKTFVDDDDEIGFGNILYIGKDSPDKDNYSINDVFCVYNDCDMTEEYEELEKYGY